MPQVDLESIVSVCGGGSNDRKVACETLVDHSNSSESQPIGSAVSDFPPESFYISKDNEIDWLDRNAFLERKESQKGNSNSNSANLNPNLHPNSNPNSQRFSLKSKASIIGLPKSQKAFVDTKNRRNSKPVNNRLFPKRTGPATKPAPPEIEPSSPKVSCMGRVRSKRDQNRQLKNRRKIERSESSKHKSSERRKHGLISSFRSIFRSGRKEGKARENQTQLSKSPSTTNTTAVIGHDIRSRLPPDDVDAVPAEMEGRRSVSRKSFESEPVGLGGMNRFASGRRSDAWAGDVNMA